MIYMVGLMLNDTQTTFVIFAFLFQVILIVHFALRRWAFQIALRYGPIVYALGIVAFLTSVWFILEGASVSFWLAGALYLIWGIFGYLVEYVYKMDWRSPFRPALGIPYLLLYLATTMFYWFPLGLITRPLWYLYGGLFLISTILNVTSHRRPG